jgi:hypothetical protein
MENPTTTSKVPGWFRKLEPVTDFDILDLAELDEEKRQTMVNQSHRHRNVRQDRKRDLAFAVPSTLPKKLKRNASSPDMYQQEKMGAVASHDSGISYVQKNRELAKNETSFCAEEPERKRQGSVCDKKEKEQDAKDLIKQEQALSFENTNQTASGNSDGRYICPAKYFEKANEEAPVVPFDNASSREKEVLWDIQEGGINHKTVQHHESGIVSGPFIANVSNHTTGIGEYKDEDQSSSAWKDASLWIYDSLGRRLTMILVAILAMLLHPPLRLSFFVLFCIDYFLGQHPSTIYMSIALCLCRVGMYETLNIINYTCERVFQKF